MNQLVTLFLEVVGTCFAQRIQADGQDVGVSKAELKVRLRYCLTEMLLLKRQGATFDAQVYSENMLASVRQYPDSEDTWKAFDTYCYFQCMASTLPEFPVLIRYFRFFGLGEWAELEADQDTLYPFAWRIIQGMEQAVLQSDDLPQDDPVEAAELIERISGFFEIPLSPRLQGIIELYLIDYASGDDAFGVWPSSSLQ